jgi:hypothetical protein
MAFTAFTFCLLIMATVFPSQAEDLSQALDSFEAKVAAETANFNKTLDVLRSEVIAELEVIAKAAIAKGDAKGAAEGWKEVLRLDTSNVGARQFFEVFGKLDETLKEVEGQSKFPSRTRWAISPTKDNPKTILKFERKKDGTWVEYSPDGAVSYSFTQKKSTTDYIELLDSSRNVYVRIHGEFYYVKTPFHEGNLWECSNGSGSWLR